MPLNSKEQLKMSSVAIENRPLMKPDLQITCLIISMYALLRQNESKIHKDTQYMV